MSDLHDLTALQQAAAIAAKEITSHQLVSHYLERIACYSDALGAFATVTAQSALRAAQDADARQASGAQLTPLHGVPTAIKDLTATAGVRTTYGSAAFAEFVPSYDDDVVRFLRDAGVISVGKTNAPEFGLACYTANKVAPPARTPHDTDRMAGGSSGGAAAAVAAGLIPFAHGTDGGGSIRIPAAMCGLVGIKTSRGRVSRGPLGSDPLGLSVAGPIARNTADAAALLDAMCVAVNTEPAGVAPLPNGGSFLQAASRAPGKLRIGRTLDTPVAGVHIDSEVAKAYDATSQLLQDLGHEVVDLDLPSPEGMLDAFVTVWAVLAHLTPLPPGAHALLTPLTRYLLDEGSKPSGPEVAAAFSAVQYGGRRLIQAMQPYDVVLTPTVARTPRPVGYFTDGGDPALDFARQMTFTPWTAQVNMTGQPAISVPVQWTSEGLPIGMQFIGSPGDECTLISLSAQLELAHPWAGHRPAPWWS
ncbi:amidase [Nakamurella antarctica]|uniref:Amidase n=1 Tax=Nakamurella antarctica TaxID=1902245 RepID=A0A3G8ZUZ7_9ACTN|nr:amidase [Nakamurella antarctica]AZI58304.1 amidase [Nakamurella antarctica]